MASAANPAREIADLAQTGLDLEAFARETLVVLERTIGFDSAVFSGLDGNPPFITHNVDGESAKLLEQATRLAPTRYARDLLPATEAFGSVGGCLDHQIYSSHERCNLPIFREVVRPARMRSLILLCARWRGRPMMLLNLGRDGPHSFRASALDRALHILPTVELGLVALTIGQRSEVPLSPRESEVARHVARGLTTPQIAQILGTSPLTVRNQLVRIFDKLGVASRSELAALIASREAPFSPGGLPLLGRDEP